MHRTFCTFCGITWRWRPPAALPPPSPEDTTVRYRGRWQKLPESLRRLRIGGALAPLTCAGWARDWMRTASPVQPGEDVLKQDLPYPSFHRSADAMNAPTLHLA